MTKSVLPEEMVQAKPGQLTIGFLEQELNITEDISILESAMKAFPEIEGLQETINKISKELETREDYESKAYEKILTKLASQSEAFEQLEPEKLEAQAVKVLKGLGFQDAELHDKISTLSGGWKMRVILARILLEQPNVLLLDEPTNHLDIESIIWLEGYLKNYEGAIILISHDRAFLDAITQRTLEIENGKFFDYKASYTNYLGLRDERRRVLEAQFKNQQNKIEQTSQLIEKFRYKKNKAKFAQSLIKKLDKMDRVELDDAHLKSMSLNFLPAPRSGAMIYKTENLKKQYGEKIVFDNINFTLERKEKVAFVGQNGQGKTTLATILAGLNEASSGHVERGHNIKMAYYAQDQSKDLNTSITLFETLELEARDEMRTKIRSILGAMLFSGEDVDKKVSVLSGGERARLAFAKLLMHQHNLLIMDEPTNHLDIASKDILKKAIENYDGAVILVSHDRNFLTGLTDRTIEFRDGKVIEYLGDVTYFLEKRGAENMREVEMSKKKKQPKKKEKPQQENNVSNKENQKIKKAIRSIEQKIEKVERKIKTIETEMAKTSFYHEPGSEETIAEYQKLKQQNVELMADWEKMAAKL